MTNLKKFGTTMGFAFLAVTLLLFLRQKHGVRPALVMSLLFFTLSAIAPDSLRLANIIWARLGEILNWAMTRLILFVLFYLIFTPMGLVMKLFGLDLLDMKIENKKQSYWHKKQETKFNQLDYERQF